MAVRQLKQNLENQFEHLRPVVLALVIFLFSFTSQKTAVGPIETFTLDYGGRSRLAAIGLPNGTTNSFSYNAKGEYVAFTRTDSDGGVREYKFALNASGEVSAMTDPDGNTTRYLMFK